MTYLTDADVAERLQVDEATAVKWRLRYSWPHLKLGRQVRYTEADLRVIEQRHHVTPTQVDALPDQTPRSAARAAS